MLVSDPSPVCLCFKATAMPFTQNWAAVVAFCPPAVVARPQSLRKLGTAAAPTPPCSCWWYVRVVGWLVGAAHKQSTLVAAGAFVFVVLLLRQAGAAGVDLLQLPSFSLITTPCCSAFDSLT